MRGGGLRTKGQHESDTMNKVLQRAPKGTVCATKSFDDSKQNDFLQKHEQSRTLSVLKIETFILILAFSR